MSPGGNNHHDIRIFAGRRQFDEFHSEKFSVARKGIKLLSQTNSWGKEVIYLVHVAK